LPYFRHFKTIPHREARAIVVVPVGRIVPVQVGLPVVAVPVRVRHVARRRS